MPILITERLQNSGDAQHYAESMLTEAPLGSLFMKMMVGSFLVM